jgi:hypothetical protein
VSLRSRIRGGQDYVTDKVATAAQFLTLRLIPIGSTHMGCDDSDGPGHAPRYLYVRPYMKRITIAALLIFIQACAEPRNNQESYKELKFDKHFNGVHVVRLSSAGPPYDFDILLGDKTKASSGGIQLPLIHKDTKVLIADWKDGVVFDELKFEACPTEVQYNGEDGIKVDIIQDGNLRATITGFSP